MEVLSLGLILLKLLMLVIKLLVLDGLIEIIALGLNLDFFWLLLILIFGVLMNEPLVFSTFIEDLSIPCKQPLALQFFQYLRHLKLLCTP